MHNSVEDFALRDGCLPSCRHSFPQFYADESLPHGCSERNVAQNIQLRREGRWKGDSPLQRRRSVGRSSFITSPVNIIFILHQMFTPCSYLLCTMLFSLCCPVLVYTVFFINCGSRLGVYRLSFSVPCCSFLFHSFFFTPTCQYFHVCTLLITLVLPSSRQTFFAPSAKP